MHGGHQKLYDGGEGRPVFKAPHPAIPHQIVPENRNGFGFGFTYRGNTFKDFSATARKMLAFLFLILPYLANYYRNAFDRTSACDVLACLHQFTHNGPPQFSGLFIRYNPCNFGSTDTGSRSGYGGEPEKKTKQIVADFSFQFFSQKE